ncbi:uncharacterized protein LOC125788847 [Astyanax mexicanus]|uniref:uncharacterized protein LOC125788847 n=1 Tax=Astyanax mexicanus TaxID=7994 RepID=UPI0020CACE0E|nr:uncharacterized protein LOC125788847 [Astyanax mexicanus]
MAAFTPLLLLLMVFIVSAVQKEIHFYHISTVHYSPFHTTSPELPDTVRPDDENLDSEETQELFIHLLEIIYNSTEHAERNICEMERFSRGAVTLSNSTSDHGLTVLYRIATDDTVQCVVLNSDLPVDEEDSPSLSQVSRDYLVRRCMERIFRGCYEAATGSEDDFWFNNISDCVNSHLVRIILTAKPPAEEATREDLNDVQMDEDQGGEDSDQVKRRLAASMDIPLTLAGDDFDQKGLTPAGPGDYEGQNRLIPARRRFAASKDIPLTLAGDYEGQNRLIPARRRFAASKDIPLTLAGDDGDDGDEGQNRLAAGLTPDRRRFAASMDIPLTLANVCGEDDEGQNRLTAGLSPAGRKLAASMDIPLTMGKVEYFTVFQ